MVDLYRKHAAPQAYSHLGLNVLSPRRGRTRRALWGYSPGALGVTAPVHDRTPRLLTRRTLPIDDRAEAPAERVGGAVTAVPKARSWLTGEGSTPLPTGNRLSPRAYSPRAVGVLSSLHGRTRLSPRAYSGLALGVRESRRGRTLLAPWARSQPSRCALGGLAQGASTGPSTSQSSAADMGIDRTRNHRANQPSHAHTRTFNHGAALAVLAALYERTRVSAPRQHCPIDDEHAHAKAPQATPAAPRAMRDTTVFAVDGRPPEQNRPRAKAQGPRRARGGHRYGRALRAFMITRGASTPRPGRTNRSRRAYQPGSRPGVPTARGGRTNRSRRAYQAGSTIGPRGSTLHEHCPIDDEAERPRQARRWRRPGRAPARLRVGGGRKHASPWAYRPRAVGVLTKRRGHTYTAPWAQSRCAPGVLTLRPGRTHPARWAYCACAPGPHRTHCACDAPGRHHSPRSKKCTPHVLTARTQPQPKARAERAVSTGTAAPWTRSGLTTEGSTPLPGPTQRSPWAYRSRAVGVLTKRRGRTYTAPWVPSRYAPGILATRPGRTQRALGVLGARRSHSAGPHRANTAPSTTKTPTPEPHNRHPGGQRACATQQVFAAQAKPSDQNRTTAKAEGPRGPRREHGHGRALDAFMVTRAQQHRAVGVPTARRGRTSRPPRAYRPLAVGVPAARPGRTSHAPWAYSPHAPWAYSPRALGALARRPGRTRPGPRSDSAGRHSTNAAHRRQSRSPRRARRGRRHRRAKGAVRIERGRNHVSPYAPCA